MKKFFWLTLLICIMDSGSSMAIAKSTAGRPCRNSDFDVLPGFVTPPPGYGEVPFYWWLGDTLTREHLLDQLEMMKGKGISSLQVNYAHSDKGGKNYGLTLKSEPPIFSDDWWELFGWFMVEANKRGMTVSLSDYTLGAGQEQYVDEILEKYPDLTGYVLRSEEHIADSKPTTISLVLKNAPLTTIAYKLDGDSTIIKGSGISLDKNVKNKTLSWKAPQGLWKIISVYPEEIPLSYDPMNPKAGNEYVAHFFQRFEDKFPEDSKGALNFFFSDELDFRLRGWMWDDYIQKEFLDRKGYDIMPYLAELFVDGSDLTPKYRLDYNDVMVSLSEENFFEPVFNWHEDRGLIFGCDHGGRGKDITEFGDYFRTQRWNQGPGCDQPSLGKDVIKNKVASSIAHLYDRPRTWLEGFYGSGWDTSSAMLLDALFANYAQGQNLLSLHGLYYCTPDGWWEWAPPCNHFRMPYWEEMPALLSCMERLSYLLSQGHHCADVAILYPVEPVIVGDGNEAVQTAFALGEELYSKGIDFDFIDYQSLAKAEIKDGKVSIAGENYSVLIIPSMKTIHLESLKKAAELQKQGGLALSVGTMPTTTENGTKDAEACKLASSLRNADRQEVYGIISSEIIPDFKVATPNPYIMHRKIGKRDVYAVYNVDKGQECYFRVHGGVQFEFS